MLRRSVLSLLALVALAGGASAQPAVGPEFRVNTYTTYDQGESAVAADANGNFVVVWSSRYQYDELLGVFGQRFDRLGNPQGGEFTVNTFTRGYQGEPQVAVHPAGNFVVTWTSGYGQDGDGYGIFARRYDAAGNAAGPEFAVNTYSSGNQFRSDVARTAGGGFVVVWTSYLQEGPDDGVFGQVFDASGNPVGAEFQVNTYTTGHQGRPTVATAPSGDFVVVWASYAFALGIGQDGSAAGIFGQRFNAGGGRLGGEFRINTYTPYAQDDPDVVMDASGNFVVVWNSDMQDGSNYGVFGQRFDATGALAGGEFTVNTYTTNHQARPSIAGEPDGHFVVSWTSSNQVNAISAGYEVFAQRFDPAAAKVGPEFRVNTYTTSDQFESAVASLGEEKFVVAWTSFSQDGDGYGVFAQRFGDLIFRDGFESSASP